MLGSIPQQDVFQRVASAHSENAAANSAVLGGSLYFVFAFIPYVLAHSSDLGSTLNGREFNRHRSTNDLANL